MTVADTGIGIDPEQQPLVFDRFYRAARDNDEVDNPDGGAGIGLAVVADLVHAHHGNITLDSVPGRGQHLHRHHAAGHAAGARRIRISRSARPRRQAADRGCCWWRTTRTCART